MKYIRPFQTSKAHSRIFMDECFYICQLTPTWQDSASGCRDWKRCGNRTWLAKWWWATTFKGRSENKDDKSGEKSKAVQSNLLKLDHTDCLPPNMQEFVKCSLFCQPQLNWVTYRIGVVHPHLVAATKACAASMIQKCVKPVHWWETTISEAYSIICGWVSSKRNRQRNQSAIQDDF